MRCELCGTPLDGPGRAHSCPAVPARTFALATRRVVSFAVAYAVVVVVTAVLGLVGYAAVRGSQVDAGVQASVLLTGLVAGVVGLACVLGLLICSVVWVVSAHRLTPAGPGFAGYGALAVAVVLLALAYVLPALAATVDGAVATEAALRIGGVAVLAAGVLVARARIGRVIGQVVPEGPQSLLTREDWDASAWDPEVLRDIERERRARG